MKLISAVILLLSCLAQSAYGVDIVPTGQVANIGDAYSAERETFMGSRCVYGAENSIGVGSSTLWLDQSLSQNQAENDLGFSVGGRARYGVMEASASAGFLTRSISNDFSTSSIYSAEYTFKQRKLSEPRLNDIGQRVSGNPERWRTTCGSSYVSEVRQGAKFFFSIKIDFKSKEEKQEFSVKFDISGPAASVNGTLQQASKHFSKKTKVTVSVLQIGGDVQKVSGIFLNDAQGRTDYLECTLGSFDSCSKVLANALAYATDTNAGFPAQLNQVETRADLVYVVTPYESAGIFEGPPPFFNEIVALKRARLSELFEDQYAKRKTVRSLRNVNPLPPRSVQLDDVSKLIDKNLNAVYTAGRSCYDNANLCAPLVDNLEIIPINDAVFAIPTLEQACIYALQSRNFRQERFMEALAWVDGRLKRLPPDENYADGHFPVIRTVDLCGGLDTERNLQTFVEFRDVVDLSEKSVLAAGGARYELSDINLLQAGPQIKQLHLNGQMISDIEVIGLLEKLEWLELDGNQIKDISPLKGLDQLETLSLSGNKVRDVSPLSGLHNLRVLQMAGNTIQDVSELKDLPRLTIIDLGHNQITKLDGLSTLANLNHLDVRNNNITSLKGFNPIRLSYLKLEDNPLSVADLADFCKRSRATTVYFTAFPGTYGSIVVTMPFPEDPPRLLYKSLQCIEVK